MATATDLREAVSLLLSDKATPKDALAKLAEFEGQPGVETAIHDLKALPWNAKAKAEPVLRDLLDKADEAEVSGAVARLPEIEDSITELMKTAGTALLSIGELLNEAREEFDNAKDFLAWSLEKFGFKKAYVYRLMQVADEFKADDILAGQSIRVLHKLAGLPEEVKQAAREQVQQGDNLTGKDVDKLSKGDEEPAQEPEQPKAGQSTTVDENDQHAAALGDDEGAPWSAGTGREAPTGEPPKAVEPEVDPEVKRLRELVSELQAELAAARQEREAKAKGKAQAPMLPQFTSECYYARLGLSAEQGSDPAEVRKAFRALVKAGYTSQHEAYPALVEAKDNLMQVAEAA